MSWRSRAGSACLHASTTAKCAPIACLLEPHCARLVPATPMSAARLSTPHVPPPCFPHTDLQDKWGPMLEQPFARRAPWLEDVLPATRELMQALQVRAR